MTGGACGRAVLFAATMPLVMTVVLPQAGAADDMGSDTDEAGAPGHTAAERTRAAALVGTFLPLSLAASTEGQRAWAASVGGYDSARGTGSFEASAEARLWGPISLRGAAVYTSSGRVLRPSVGARVQVLREARHGVGAAVGVFYRPEGLTEPEGEIETVLSVGRHFERVYGLGNLLYGQDPEANERDGELRLALLSPLGGRFLGGLDGRLRFDLGSNSAKRSQHHEPTLDALVGPFAAVLVGPMVLSLQGGSSVVRAGGVTTYGGFALLGVGAAL